MRDISLRTIGATIILAALAFLVTTQRQIGESTPADIDAEPTLPTFSVVGEPTDTRPANEGLEYRVGLLAAPSTDNFWAYYGAEQTIWNAYVLGGTKPALLGIDPDTLDVVPDLATAVAQPERKGGEWRLRVDLDRDRIWSDGTPITGGDIEYTFDVVTTLGLSGGWKDAFPANVTDVRAVGKHRVFITFENRPSLNEWPYGIGFAPVMPAHRWRDITDEAKGKKDLYGASGEGDVSGGVLEITGFGQGAVTAAVTPQAANPDFEAVTFSVHEDEDDAVGALVNNEIDYILSPTGLSERAQTDLAGRADIRLVSSPANSVRYLGFNLNRQPMSDPAFRTALDLVFDRTAAVDEIVPSADPAFSLLPPANVVWSNTTVLDIEAQRHRKTLQRRVKDAVAMLENAGYTWETSPSVDGNRMVPGKGLLIDGLKPAPLTILTTGDKYDSARPAYAAEVEDALEVLGFDARPVVTDFETVVDLAFTPQGEDARKFDMYILGWTVGNAAHPDFYGQFFVGDGPINSAGYSSDEFATAWKTYRDATTQQEAYEALWEMEAVLAQDLPYLPFYHPTLTEAYRTDRVSFEFSNSLGGIQGRLAGIPDVKPAD